MKSGKISTLALIIVLAAGIMTACNVSKPYPAAKDITVIIPKGAGGGTDISTRGALQYLGKYIDNAKFVCVNKPDGGGVTGMMNTALAKPDGYTLGAVTVELAMFPHQDKCKVTYQDFAPIFAQIAAPAALIVPSDSPYNTLDEFVAYCKANPRKVQMGNSGMGAIWHVAAMSFENEFNVELKHVPYPNGTADIIAALVGGHIDATLADPSGVLGQYKAGKIKILSVMAAERSKIYPDVPTFAELGHNMTIRAWACIVAPKETHAEILSVLRNAAAKLVEDPDYQAYMIKQGIDPVNIVGETCYEMMKADHKMFGEMLPKIEGLN